MSTPQDDLEAFFTMHTGHLSAVRRNHLGEQFKKALAAAEARGFERAREMAAALCETAEVPISLEDWRDTKKHLSAQTARGLATLIRAMKDED